MLIRVARLTITNDKEILACVQDTATNVATNVATSVAESTLSKEVKRLSIQERREILDLTGPRCLNCNRHLDDFRKLVHGK